MILCVGDLHFKENLGYADYIKDRRKKEKKQILDLIVKESKSCDTVVMLGDQLNGRNNLSSVIKDFVVFIERFRDKEVYIMSGNHERKGDGSTALDFLKEIDKPNWHIITNREETTFLGKKAVFMPYMTKSELGVTSNEEGAKKIMELIGTGDILFIHHTISDTLTVLGQKTDVFSEIILPKDELEKKFQLVIGGHIHGPQVNNSTIITGSIFNNEVGESNKKIWRIAPMDMNYYEIDLPGRPIIQARNMCIKTLEATDPYPKNAIVKMIIDKPDFKNEVEDIKKYLREHVEAYILLEQYPRERKKIHFDEGMLEFNIEDLLKAYAKQKKVDEKKILSAWELIKK